MDAGPDRFFDPDQICPGGLVSLLQRRHGARSLWRGPSRFDVPGGSPMAKRRKTIDTTRLTASLINPEPETADHDVGSVPARKAPAPERHVTDLLHDLREVGTQESEAMRELSLRYDGLLDRHLARQGHPRLAGARGSQAKCLAQGPGSRPPRSRRGGGLGSAACRQHCRSAHAAAFVNRREQGDRTFPQVVSRPQATGVLPGRP
jgi:hypothetical protein